MRRPAWLDRESERWRQDGIITAEQRAAILNRYPALPGRTAASVLTWLALLTGGAGVVLIAGWNWDRIPQAWQLGTVFGMPAVAFAGALVADAAGRDLWTRRLTLLGALVAGAIFVAVADIYHSPDPGLSVLWPLALCASAALVPSGFLISVAGGVTILWLIIQTGSPPPPWMFLLLGPLLAFAVEQVPDRTAGSVVSAAVAVWAFSVSGSTWPDANASLLVYVLLAAAALDAWAHAPANRRPAFARPLTAAVFLLLPLGFLQIGYGEVRSDPWAGTISHPLPALSLAAALGAVAIWPAVRSRALVRSAGFGALALVWLGVWLFAPDAINAPGARWPWMVAFGAALILAGVSFVREAARERSASLFALGVIAVALFVVTRAIDAQGALWPSAFALFGGAALLAWLGRAWAKRS